MNLEIEMSAGPMRASIPVQGDVSDPLIRQLAWEGFKHLVAATTEPPAEFRIEQSLEQVRRWASGQLEVIENTTNKEERNDDPA